MGCVVLQAFPTTIQPPSSADTGHLQVRDCVWLVPRSHSPSPPHSQNSLCHLEVPQPEGRGTRAELEGQHCLLGPQFLHLCGRNWSQRVNQSDSEVKDGWAELYATSQLDGPAVLG